ncbi:hypothetical protein Acr_26g0010250 [Actinidia rufa]|uniref:Uncharacterized protein n=1 Tax=Actinidia rufa TaxID=165716 RepID=A0A7J0H477_9ERIC|nr:hypothetical protein Acr_26g0010250 [Actinidia rufa]
MLMKARMREECCGGGTQKGLMAYSQIVGVSGTMAKEEVAGGLRVQGFSKCLKGGKQPVGVLELP